VTWVNLRVKATNFSHGCSSGSFTKKRLVQAAGIEEFVKSQRPCRMKSPKSSYIID
jgi:hypothetical protein